MRARRAQPYQTTRRRVVSQGDSALKAVILAAGSSTRLYPLTVDTPKCLLEVGGQTLLQHQLDALGTCGVSEVVVVTGYLSHLLVQKIETIKSQYEFGFSFAHNARFAETNNLYSLWTARKQTIGDDFLCLHADVLFHPEILHAGARAADDVCLVADREVLEETMKLKTVGERVTAVGKHVQMAEASGTFLGLAKFSAEGGRRMFAEVERLVEANDTNVYFTAAIERLIADKFPIAASFVENWPWIEIDFAEELVLAREVVFPQMMEA